MIYIPIAAYIAAGCVYAYRQLKRTIPKEFPEGGADPFMVAFAFVTVAALWPILAVKKRIEAEGPWGFLLNWLTAWACLADGLVGILTLGLVFTDKAFLFQDAHDTAVKNWAERSTQ